MKHTLHWQASNEAIPLWGDRESAWLTHTGSLTQRLREVTKGQIEHRIYHESMETPEADECDALGLTVKTQSHLREIDWWYGGALLIAARVVIPFHESLPSLLAKIGKRSLGDVLFSDSTSTRRDLEFAVLSRAHPFFYRVQQHVPMDQEFVWIRRSLFELQNILLLVSEIFLPTLFNIPIK